MKKTTTTKQQTNKKTKTKTKKQKKKKNNNDDKKKKKKKKKKKIRPVSNICASISKIKDKNIKQKLNVRSLVRQGEDGDTM